MLAAAVVGCDGTTNGPGAACDVEPCLDPPVTGIQVRNQGTTISPGEDIELCEIVQLPGSSDELHYVRRIESAMVGGSHHLIVAAIDPGSQTEADASPGQIVECISPAGVGEAITPVTATQLPYYDESFPAGVARAYRGGQYLVFNYHYLNTTDEPIEARAAINLHEANADEIERLMGDAVFSNFDIDTPPGESRTFTTECRFDRDVMVHKLMRHTHQWGTDFPVHFAGGSRDGELIYTSPDYEHPDHVFDEPIEMRAGEGFRFDCNFVNTTSKPLRFGFNATDEMCILYAQIFDPETVTAPVEVCFAN